MIQDAVTFGQTKINSYFDRVYSSGRIPHALIICGEKGSGKLTMAKNFANQCLGVTKDFHPDIRILDLYEMGGKYTENIREQIINNIPLWPMSGKYKFYIINGAGKMTIQAQNAILKSLEEPPEYVSIIMLTDNLSALLPTIKSRSVILYIQQVDYNKIADFLIKNYGADEGAAYACAHMSRGNALKALDYLNNPQKLEKAEILSGMVRGIAQGNASISYKDSLNEFKEDFDNFLELMDIFTRDVLVYKSVNDTSMLVYPNWQQDVKYMSENSSYKKLENIINKVSDARVASKANVGKETLMELIMLEIGGSI